MGLSVDAVPLAVVWRVDWRRIRPPFRRLGWHKCLSGLVYMEAITYLLMVLLFSFLIVLFLVSFQKDFVFIKRSWVGNSLAVQWLGLHALTVGA